MNELNYNVYSDKEDIYDLSKNEIEFMLPLEIYKYLHTELPAAEKNRCLFFNLLFNKIGYDRVIPFLNFYFDSYHKDKKEFLRIFKLDIDEIFERFEIPWREKKLILRNPTGSAFWDTSKLVISEIMPFFDPYDYNTYVNYKRRYKEANYWIKNKCSTLSPITQKTKINKEYRSLTRARAFYIGLLQESGKMNFLNGSVLMKDNIIQFAKDTWEGQSGKTVYEEVLLIISDKNPINKKYKEEHLKDFNYGLKLFKENFPD